MQQISAQKRLRNMNPTKETGVNSGAPEGIKTVLARLVAAIILLLSDSKPCLTHRLCEYWT
jgi:hypothetical protein